MNTIKAVYTNNFEIILSEVQTLFELDYVVSYKRSEDPDYKTSEHIKDFRMADFMFNSKLQELEGN